MTTNPSNEPSLLSAHLMAMEVISELLASAGPGQLSQKLTEQLRELTGARSVLLLAHSDKPDSHELIGACPLRRATLFSAAELDHFCPLHTPEALPVRPQELPPEHPLRAPLLRGDVESLLRFPLRAGGELVGSLLLLDLPELDRMDEVTKTITPLLPVIAIALRNAFAHQRIEQQARELESQARELERRVTVRTADLATANETLRESEHRFRVLFEQAAVGVAQIRSDTGQFVRVNRKYCDIVGYSREEMERLDFQTITHPDDLALDLANMELLKAGRIREFSMEKRYFRKDGSLVWVNLTISPMWVPGEPPNFHIAVVEDITARKQAGRELRLLTDTITASLNEIYIFDADTLRFRFVNEGALRNLGYTAAQMQDLTPLDLKPELTRESFRELVAPLRRHERPLQVFETIHRRANGSLYPVEVHLQLMEHDGLRVFLAVIQDITERKRAEAALRDSEKRYHDLFDKANEGLFMMTGDGQISEVNQAFAEMHGYKVDELRRIDIRALDVLKERAMEDRADIIPRIQAGEVVRFEVEHYHKDGHTFPLAVTTSMIESGDRTYYMAFHQDITERKRAEAALRASLEEKTALLKEVHHRVKNNLQVISSLLRLQSGQMKNAEAHTALLNMQGRVRSMALIHEQLYQSANLAQVDLAAYLKRLCGQLFHALAAHPGAVQLHLDLALVRLGIDQAIPCGLLVNELVSNCLKHAFPEGRTGEVRVELQPVPDSPALRLRVADNGVGLPAGFDLKSLKSLGLELVSTLTRQLQGRLEIGPGPGAEFKVVFTPRSDKVIT